MTDPIEITDHACIRWLERVAGINMDWVRSQIQSGALSVADEFGAPIVVGRNGERIVVKNGAVVTVLRKRRAR